MKQSLLFILLLLSANCMAVIDSIPPVITLNGQNPLNHILNSTYTDAGATAFDNVDGNITSSITSNITASNPNKDLAAYYTIIYSASDQAGNTATATRTIHVYNEADFLAAGNYNGVDSCPSIGVSFFNCSITTSSTVNWEFIINNFAAFGTMVNITANATGIAAGSTITFPSNQPLWAGGAIISANGILTSVSPVEFSVTYLWTDGTMSEQCTTMYIMNSVSVREIATKSFIKIYPNPSDGIVNIESMKRDIEDVSVYDIHGILVHQEIINEREAKLDLREMTAGIYFLRSRLDGREQIDKIVIR
jgi:hypothetical protein